MEKIIKKAKEVREAVIESFIDVGFTNLEVDYAIYSIGGEFNKIKFFDAAVDTEPYGNKHYFEITYIENEVFLFVGEQIQEDFALSIKALKSIAELCEIVNEYLKESEKDNEQSK